MIIKQFDNLILPSISSSFWEWGKNGFRNISLDKSGLIPTYFDAQDILASDRVSGLISAEPNGFQIENVLTNSNVSQVLTFKFNPGTAYLNGKFPLIGDKDMVIMLSENIENFPAIIDGNAWVGNFKRVPHAVIHKEYTRIYTEDALEAGQWRYINGTNLLEVYPDTTGGTISSTGEDIGNGTYLHKLPYFPMTDIQTGNDNDMTDRMRGLVYSENENINGILYSAGSMLIQKLDNSKSTVISQSISSTQEILGISV